MTTIVKVSVTEYLNWRKNFYTSQKRTHLRLGQAFINWRTPQNPDLHHPKLFYETNPSVAEDIISKEFLIDNPGDEKDDTDGQAN